MPWTCPACFRGSDTDLAGERRPWYRVEQDGHVRCRTCDARFKEHPDGTLTADPEP